MDNDFMEIIFKNIPKRTNPYDIVNLISPILKKGLFREEGDLHYFKRVEITNFDNSISDYHFLALITPDTAAKRVIKKLNGYRLNNLVLSVSEFVIRDQKNCRRCGKPIVITHEHEMRIFDRRVKNQIVLISSDIS